MMRIRPVGLAVLSSAAMAAAGCFGISGQDYAAVQRKLADAQDQIRKLQSDVAAKQQTIDLMRNERAQGLGLKPEELEQLVVPVKIELERLSGGYDNDDKPGDDGIVVYVQPTDRDGDVIKAAGSIKVTLLDLANPPDRYLIGEYSFDVPHTRELWSGKLWTSHFSVHCPWYQGKPPAHAEITARVQFRDLLTKQELTAQGVYKIQFPPGHSADGS